MVSDFVDLPGDREQTFYTGGESGVRHIPME